MSHLVALNGLTRLVAPMASGHNVPASAVSNALSYAASNSTGLPFDFTFATTNNVRHYFLPAKIAGTDYNQLNLTFLGWAAYNGYTTAAGYTPSLEVAVRQGDGVWRRGVMKSNGTYLGTVPNDGHATCYVPGNFLAGDNILIYTRIVGPAASTAYLMSHGAVDYRGGGMIEGTDAGISYVTGANVGFGAVADAVMSAGTIIDVTAVQPGHDYVGGTVYFLCNEAGGKDAYYAANVTGGQFTGGFFIAPGSLFVTKPQSIVQNAFASTTAIYGPSIISGVPKNGVAPVSCLAAGDSTDRGYTSSDTYGDANGNYGPLERKYNSAFGIINFAVSQMTATGWFAPEIKANAALVDNGVKINNFYNGLGINDATGGRTFSQIADDLKVIDDGWRAKGAKILRSDWEPSTTGVWTGDPSVNQAPRAGAGAVSTRTTHNAQINVDARLLSNYAKFTAGSAVQDATYPWAWNGSAGIALTDDGQHDGGWGTGTPAKSGSTYNFYPPRGIEYAVANIVAPTLTP